MTRTRRGVWLVEPVTSCKLERGATTVLALELVGRYILHQVLLISPGSVVHVFTQTLSIAQSILSYPGSCEEGISPWWSHKGNPTDTYSWVFIPTPETTPYSKGTKIKSKWTTSQKKLFILLQFFHAASWNRHFQSGGGRFAPCTGSSNLDWITEIKDPLWATGLSSFTGSFQEASWSLVRASSPSGEHGPERLECSAGTTWEVKTLRLKSVRYG